jgi:Domain of unknown function (DUF5753)/Helix-turn-helix domain
MGAAAQAGDPRDLGAGPGSAVARMMLGGQLRRVREAAGVSPDGAAYHIRASRAKISRMENGRQRFKDRDILDLLDLYNVTDAEVIAGMLALAGRARAEDWWAGYGDILPGWFEPYLGLEAAATVIRAFDHQFISGLFQTPDYARAVTELGHRTAGRAEISRRVAVRMQRQQLLAAERPPMVWAVLDEAALRRPVGGAAVMREQVRHLIAVAERPRVTLQVLPFAAGGHDAGGTFSILRFAEPGVADVVYSESLTGAVYLDRPAATDHYLEIMDRLSLAALSAGQTTRFLAGLLP